jgi:hypothetical protein
MLALRICRRSTLAGPVRWRYWPPKRPARHCDFLIIIRDPHALQKNIGVWSQFLRPAIDSNTAKSAWILSVSYLCHTIEN